MITIERPINTFIRLPGDVAPKNDATMSPPNTEANPRPQPIADWLLKQEVLEIKQESAVFGERLEDVPTKPLARGATQKMLVAPEKAKAKAEAKVRARAKARVKEKVKEKAKAKRVAKRAVKKEDDLGLARPAAEHPLPRGMAHLRVDDRLPRIQRKCVLCTQKGNVQKATQSAHSYTIRHANGTRRADVEMEPNACSRIETREVCLPSSKSARN